MQLTYFIQAQIAKFFLGIYRLVGLRAGSWLGSLLGAVFGKLAKERHIAADNLRQAMPHLSNAERKTILSNCWRRIGRVVGEMAHTAQIVRESETRLLIEGEAHVRAALPNGGPAIFVSAHYSNWEMVMLGVRRVAGETAAIYRHANNPYMEKWISEQRGNSMPIQIKKGSSGAREMIKALQNDISIAALIDQRLSTGDPIEFFGRPTKAPSGVIKLARRFGVPVIPTVVRRRDDGPDMTHFVQTFYPAIDVPKTDNMQGDIDIAMRQIYDYLEQWISERPEEWFWQHNRWK